MEWMWAPLSAQIQWGLWLLAPPKALTWTRLIIERHRNQQTRVTNVRMTVDSASLGPRRKESVSSTQQTRVLNPVSALKKEGLQALI
jgi:hypothetical protein